MQESQSGQVERALRLQAGRVGFEAVVPSPKLKLLEQVREVMRLRHYSIRTEQSYCDWIRRYVRFHRMRSRAELIPGAAKVEQLLSDLAVNGHVAAATQNQAFNALLFLDREVLHEPFENVQAVRAKRPIRVPTVLTPEEVKRVIEAMSGTPQLVAKLLYGRREADRNVGAPDGLRGERLRPCSPAWPRGATSSESARLGRSNVRECRRCNGLGRASLFGACCARDGRSPPMPSAAVTDRL